MHAARLIPALVGVSACSFEPGTVPVVDAFREPDVLVLPKSCAEIYAASPGSGDGRFQIDPDGVGPDAPLMVTCDMTSDGGGWTVVYYAPTSNIMTSPMTYTSSTGVLLQDATEALIAYRDANLTAVGDVASFPLPADWRIGPPFTNATTDVATQVSINGAADLPAMLRYGFMRYVDSCDDPWVTNAGSWGRVCVVGTKAPFYSGFATNQADTCPDSQASWNSVSCSDDRRFSIAVR